MEPKKTTFNTWLLIIIILLLGAILIVFLTNRSVVQNAFPENQEETSDQSQSEQHIPFYSNQNEENIPQNVKLISQNPGFEVKQCVSHGKTYFIADNTQLADEGNDVYDTNGIKLDSCFAYTSADAISDFCKSFDVSACTAINAN